MMSPSVFIDKERDYKYSGKDAKSFLRCCACRCYTPFLFYIVSKVALEAIRMDPNYNFFCVECVPKPASVGNVSVMYPDDCLIKNEEFLRLFEGFRYRNPYYEKYASKNRIIITEKSKIHPSFKKVARKAMPPEVKLEKIYNLFMPVHQMVCKKYACTLEMFTDIRHKYREIITAYCETNASREMYDHIDVMIERTPFQSQQSRQRSRTSETGVTSSFPSDSLHMRSGSSEESQTAESPTLGISSESRGGTTLMPDSERSVVLSEQQGSHSFPMTAIHTEVLNISSQEAENANGSGEAILTLNSSIDSSSSSILVPRNRPFQTSAIHTGDSQEAGPSGLQRETRKRDAETVTSPKPKRPRRTTAKPMNPAPTEVQSGRVLAARMPRLAGG